LKEIILIIKLIKLYGNLEVLKPIQDVVKEVKEDKVVQLKPKAKQTRKKKNEQVDLAQD
jgi:hypothetical protein